MGKDTGKCNNCGAYLSVIEYKNEDGFTIAETAVCRKCKNTTRWSLI
jgi:hypothetical protein